MTDVVVSRLMLLWRGIRLLMEFLGWVLFFAWASTQARFPFSQHFRDAVSGVFRLLGEVGQ
jgi:hypothetical protein